MIITAAISIAWVLGAPDWIIIGFILSAAIDLWLWGNILEVIVNG